MKKIMFNDKYGLTQAVLDGRKTMTRRIVSEKLLDKWTDYDDFCNSVSVENTPTTRQYYDEKEFFIDNSSYKVGEIIAIAQSYKDSGYSPDSLDRHPKDLSVRGLMKDSAGWNNKMFVKSYACKHHIKITNVKVERLQDISDEDCLKEGIIHAYTDNNGIKRYHTPHTKRGYLSTDVAQQAFAFLIDKVSGKGTWESNPFVFAYEFVLVD
nr:MAG TPA: ASCH domain protein [Caudoviricetes sp.]